MSEAKEKLVDIREMMRIQQLYDNVNGWKIWFKRYVEVLGEYIEETERKPRK